MKHIIISTAMMIAAVAGAWASEMSGEITADDLANLPAADVVILGEVHDNGVHHLSQAAAMRTLKPKAVVFEMLSAKQAALITPKLLQDQAALQATLAWDESGWPDFGLYYPVFAALGDAKIYGAARPRDEVRRAFSEGAAAVFGMDGAKAFGLEQPLPDDQLMRRTQEQFEAHCEAMPMEMMGGMVEAQRFRDAAFADVVVRAAQAVAGPVVLVAGNGHARVDWAVPFMLKIAAPDLSVLAVGILEGPVTETPPYDLWLQTEAAEREDPCLTFK